MRPLLGTLLVALLALPASAATQLTFLVNGKPTSIAWPADAFPISYSVASSATQKIPNGEGVIGRSFSSWSSVEGSRVDFSSGGVAALQAGRDGVNSISVNGELFSSAGFLAFTTTWFDDAGLIQESDIQIDGSILGDIAKLEGLIEHEIGHLLGLDHSAVVSSTMYPYIASDGLSGLDSDDRVAIATMYPKPGFIASRGEFRGSVFGSTGPLFGAQVVAVNHVGSPVSSGLTNRDGRFEIRGVPAGNYRLYVEPLDGPVDPRNLSGVWRGADASEFRTEFLRPTEMISLEPGQIHENLQINSSGPSSINPKWIGTFPAGTRDVQLGSTVSSVRAGETISIAVGGDGFIGGLTEIEILGGGFTRISDVGYGPNYAWATYRVAPDTPPGSVVILARNGEETASLTGGVRVQAAQNGVRRRPAR